MTYEDFELNGHYSNDELCNIKLALSIGYDSDALVKLYEDPFLVPVKDELSKLIHYHLPKEYFNLCMSVAPSLEKIKEIYAGYTGGLSYDTIKFYADNKYSAAQMQMIRKGFLLGASLNDATNVINEKYIPDQIRELFKGLVSKNVKDKINLYASPKYDMSQMLEIRCAIDRGFTDKQIAYFLKPEFDYRVMHSIINAIDRNCSDEILSLISNGNFNHKQIHQISSGRYDGLSDGQIMIYASNKFTSYQMKQIKKAILEDHLTDEQIKIIANPELTNASISYLRRMLRGADHNMTEFIKSLNIEYLPVIYHHVDNNQTLSILQQFSELNLSYDEMKQIINETNTKAKKADITQDIEALGL